MHVGEGYVEMWRLTVVTLSSGGKSARARSTVATGRIQDIGKSKMRVRKIGRGPEFAMHQFCMET